MNEVKNLMRPFIDIQGDTSCQFLIREIRVIRG